ncbi:type IV pilin [Haloprofundus salinisoli]|uniref:type IV pilin n=1 Tax=Haloprofundus salinisoli TaxID=2876193 RepID=UPI001CD0057C|nr:type IV pilin N-terminal domain-containing protein [Haloprofundus salinisoli]
MDISTFVDADDAVSPAIGVVLMAGITVLLAATAAGPLLEFGDSTLSAPVYATADADVSTDEDRLTVTWLSHDAADYLDVAVVVDGDHYSTALSEPGDALRLDGDGITKTGTENSYSDALDIDDGDEIHVTVTAVRDDGRTVVLRRTLTV